MHIQLYLRQHHMPPPSCTALCTGKTCTALYHQSESWCNNQLGYLLLITSQSSQEQNQLMIPGLKTTRCCWQQDNAAVGHQLRGTGALGLMSSLGLL